MTHDYPIAVEGFPGTLSDLAHAIAKMRYDKVAELIGALSLEFASQAEADQRLERTMLGDALKQVSDELKLTREGLDDIWKICAPHIAAPEASNSSQPED